MRTPWKIKKWIAKCIMLSEKFRPKTQSCTTFICWRSDRAACAWQKGEWKIHDLHKQNALQRTSHVFPSHTHRGQRKCERDLWTEFIHFVCTQLCGEAARGNNSFHFYNTTASSQEKSCLRNYLGWICMEQQYETGWAEALASFHVCTHSVA